MISAIARHSYTHGDSDSALLRPDLQQVIDDMAANSALGVVAAVKDQSGYWGSSSGFRDLAGQMAAPTDMFRAGSVVKTFIATAVLQLAADGRLGVDDALDWWLPGLVPSERGHITLRHLLNHTSGIVSFTDHMPVNAGYFLTTARFGAHEPRELIQLAVSRDSHGAPGGGWWYSNTNYVLLALVIEEVTGDPCGQVIHDRIIAPLGLRSTFLPGRSPFMPGPHLRAYAWYRTHDGPRPIDITIQSPTRAWMSGDLISTAHDLAAFYTGLFGGALLPAELFSEMMVTVTANEDRAYGLGLLRMRLGESVTSWGSTGAFGGYVTVALTSPSADRYLIASATPRGGNVIEDLLSLARKVFGQAR